MDNKICCFFGHRVIENSEEVKYRLIKTVEQLIKEKRVYTFLFGSKSQFNDLCYDVVTELKDKYSYICRIYVRAEYPDINEGYEEYLLKGYEETYFSEKLLKAGRAVYVERNYEMIDKSDFCIVYYKPNYKSLYGKSGTSIAYQYAIKKQKNIINVDF